MVLIVIDTQNEIMNNKLYLFDVFKTNIITLLKQARAHHVEVLYVRHDDGKGHPLTKGEEGFEIYDDFKPMPNEKVFDKTVNSAFKESGLLEYLKSNGEQELIMVGLQSDYCMDANITCGFEHGFHIIVPTYCNTTFDNAYMSGEKSYQYYNEYMWKDRYASCISVDETIKKFSIEKA